MKSAKQHIQENLEGLFEELDNEVLKSFYCDVIEIMMKEYAKDALNELRDSFIMKIDDNEVDLINKELKRTDL
jgi:hypothetical protein